MKSKIFSSSMIKENLKQQIWIFGLAFLALLFLYPILLMTQFDVWQNYGYAYEKIQNGYAYFLNIQENGSVRFSVITVFAALCAAVNFEYLHSSRKLDCFHSLPVKRSLLYWQKIWSSLLLFAAACGMALFLAVCVGASHGYFSLHYVKIALSAFAVYGVYFLLVYGLCVLAMMLTGRILVGILGMGVLFLYVPAVIQVLRGYAQTFFATYADMAAEPGSIVYSMDHYGSPGSWAISLMNEEYSQGFMALAVLGGLAAGVFLLFINLWIYQKRSTEAAGRSMAFGRAALVIQILMEIPAVLAVGLVGHGLVTEHSTVWWVVSMILGIVVIHGVIEVIYQADFRKFFAHPQWLALSAAAVAVVSLVYQADLIGYDRYLQKESAMASMDVRGNSLSGAYQTYLRESNGKVSFEYGYQNQDDNFLELDPDSEFYTLLEQVTQEKRQRQEDSASVTSLNIRYSLHSGKKVYRNYMVDLEQLREAAQSILKVENFKEVFYPQLEEKSAYVTDIVYENGDSYTLYYNSKRVLGDTKNEILTLLAQDVADADETVFREDPVGILDVSYSGETENGGLDAWTAYGNEGLLIYPGFERVCAYLEKEGIPPKIQIDASQVDCIRVYTWDDRTGEQEVQEEYTESKEIRDLLPSLLLPGTWTAWGEVRDNTKDAEVILKDSAQNQENLQYNYSIALDKSRELFGE